MYIEHTNEMDRFEKVYAYCEEYVEYMLAHHQYRGIIRMDNHNGSWCVAEACVRRLKDKYARTIFSRVDIDYMSDHDGCYIIITTKW